MLDTEYPASGVIFISCVEFPPYVTDSTSSVPSEPFIFPPATCAPLSSCFTTSVVILNDFRLFSISRYWVSGIDEGSSEASVNSETINPFELPLPLSIIAFVVPPCPVSL